MSIPTEKIDIHDFLNKLINEVPKTYPDAIDALATLVRYIANDLEERMREEYARKSQTYREIKSAYIPSAIISKDKKPDPEPAATAEPKEEFPNARIISKPEPKEDSIIAMLSNDFLPEDSTPSGKPVGHSIEHASAVRVEKAKEATVAEEKPEKVNKQKGVSKPMFTPPRKEDFNEEYRLTCRDLLNHIGDIDFNKLTDDFFHPPHHPIFAGKFKMVAESGGKGVTNYFGSWASAIGKELALPEEEITKVVSTGRKNKQKCYAAYIFEIMYEQLKNYELHPKMVAQMHKNITEPYTR